MKRHLFSAAMLAVSINAYSDETIQQNNQTMSNPNISRDLSYSQSHDKNGFNLELEAQLRDAIELGEPLLTSKANVLFEPNPATWQSFDCVRSVDLSYPSNDWGNVSGRVYYPSNERCNAAAAPAFNRPVVLFFNGAGFHYWDYSYLANHMAGIGFIVVVVDSSEPSPTLNCSPLLASCIEDRARKGISYLLRVKKFWNYNKRANFADLTLMGHSRGGEAAIEAAMIISREEPSLGFLLSPPSIRAVVAIAPTDIGNGFGAERRSLNAHHSLNLMLLYGSRDEQIKGYPQPFGINLPPQTAFALYDRTGTEETLTAAVGGGKFVDKSMHFISKATHSNFTNHSYIAPACQPYLSQAVQHRTTKGLVNAYLLWKVWGLNSYKRYFNADTDWLWWGPAATSPQYSTGAWNGRRVVDNFQNDILNTNTLEGGLSVNGNLSASITDNSSSGRMVHGPEDGLRLRVESGSPSNWNLLQWTIPAVEGDMSEYTHLSIRIGLGHDFEGSSRVNIRLRNGISSWSSIVSTSSYGGISPVEALDPAYVSLDCDFGDIIALDQTVVSMRTIRIPLEDFNLADLENISRLQIRFNHEDTRDRVFYIDNVEFTL